MSFSLLWYFFYYGGLNLNYLEVRLYLPWGSNLSFNFTKKAEYITFMKTFLK